MQAVRKKKAQKAARGGAPVRLYISYCTALASKLCTKHTVTREGIQIDEDTRNNINLIRTKMQRPPLNLFEDQCPRAKPARPVSLESIFGFSSHQVRETPNQNFDGPAVINIRPRTVFPTSTLRPKFLNFQIRIWHQEKKSRYNNIGDL